MPFRVYRASRLPLYQQPLKQSLLNLKYNVKLRNWQQQILSNSILWLKVAFSRTARSIKKWILESVQNGINNVNTIYCADKQTFYVDIKVSIDIDWCVESKFVSCSYCMLRKRYRIRYEKNLVTFLRDCSMTLHKSILKFRPNKLK